MAVTAGGDDPARGGIQRPGRLGAAGGVHVAASGKVLLSLSCAVHSYDIEPCIYVKGRTNVFVTNISHRCIRWNLFPPISLMVKEYTNHIKYCAARSATLSYPTTNRC